MWHVYFLRRVNGDTYVGSTKDLKRRFASHAAGRVLSTSKHLAVTLLPHIAVETEPHARSLEHYFKSGSGKAFATKRLLAPPPGA